MYVTVLTTPGFRAILNKQAWDITSNVFSPSCLKLTKWSKS